MPPSLSLIQGRRLGEVRSGRVRGLVDVAAWIGLAAFGFFALVLGELVSVAPVTSPPPEQIPLMVASLAALSLNYGLLAGGVVGLLHLLARRLGRLRPAMAWWTVAVALLLGIWPGIEQAEFLTAGDAISRYDHVAVVRGFLMAAIPVAAGGLWAWHLWGGRAGKILWWFIGLSGVALGTLLLMTRLDYYARTALFLIFPCWFFATMMLRRLVGGAQGRALGGTVALAALFVISRFDGESGRSQMLARSRIASLADLALSAPMMRGEASLDFSQPARFSCAEVATDAHAPAPIPTEARRHVIVISVDALRADMLTMQIEGKLVMPHLRAFAARSHHFEAAVTSYPATIYAIGGAFTGLSPSQLLYAPTTPSNVISETRSRFDRQVAVLPADPWFEQPIIDELLVQGAEIQRVEADAAPTTDAVLAALKASRAATRGGSGGPEGSEIFLWAHYLEPHVPYRHHEAYDYGIGSRQDYLSEVAYLDYHLGRLFEVLVADGWLDDSLVIVLADHGEALGEGGYWGHHVYLDAWLIDVPLMMHFPGVTGRRVPGAASLTDVAPTIFHFLGMPVPPAIDGRSLFAGPRPRGFSVAEAFPVRGEELFDLAQERILSLEALEARKLRLEGEASLSYESKVSIVEGDYRLIVARRSGMVELYDRRRDPQQREDLVDREPERVQDMLESLGAWHLEQSERIYCRVVRAKR